MLVQLTSEQKCNFACQCYTLSDHILPKPKELKFLSIYCHSCMWQVVQLVCTVCSGDKIPDSTLNQVFLGFILILENLVCHCDEADA